MTAGRVDVTGRTERDATDGAFVLIGRLVADKTLESLDVVKTNYRVGGPNQDVIACRSDRLVMWSIRKTIKLQINRIMKHKILVTISCLIFKQVFAPFRDWLKIWHRMPMPPYLLRAVLERRDREFVTSFDAWNRSLFQ